MAKGIYIRPSMLTGYQDCARRSATQQWSQRLIELGYQPRFTYRPSSAAAVGIAVHKAIMIALEAKLAGHAPQQSPVEAGLWVFDRELEKSDENFWDELTWGRESAVGQITNLFKSFRDHILPALRPKHIEKRYWVELDGGFHMSGTLDLLTVDAKLIDHKTSKMIGKNHFAQLGAYSLLAQTYDEPVEKIQTISLHRVKPGYTQPPPVVTEYPIDGCEDAAKETISRIKADYVKFAKDENPKAFPANPSSALCSARFCAAWGTTICNQWSE